LEMEVEMGGERDWEEEMRGEGGGEGHSCVGVGKVDRG